MGVSGDYTHGRRIRFALEICLREKVKFLQAMNTPPEESLNANGGSASVSQQTNEQPAQARHFVENDYVILLPLRASGQERASVERHAVENDQDRLH